MVCGRFLAAAGRLKGFSLGLLVSRRRTIVGVTGGKAPYARGVIKRLQEVTDFRIFAKIQYNQLVILPRYCRLVDEYCRFVDKILPICRLKNLEYCRFVDKILPICRSLAISYCRFVEVSKTAPTYPQKYCRFVDEYCRFVENQCGQYCRFVEILSYPQIQLRQIGNMPLS